jgi:type II secretory pathway pseudopilin PulG
MSLIEILVVVTILLFAAAVFVPRLKPLMDHSKIREAARVVQLYLSTARNQAMSSGRSTGVMIEPLASELGCSMTLTQIETPPPYGGDSSSSAVLTLSGTYGGVAFPYTVATATGGSYSIAPIRFDNWPSVPLYQGDQIQIGYQGFWYGVAPAQSTGLPGVTNNISLNIFDTNTAMALPNVTINTPNGQVQQCLFVYLDVSHGENPMIQNSGITAPYKIRRWPTKSAAKALQLPSPTVIDLTASGYDPAPNSPQLPTWMIPRGTTYPPTIMFAPDGTVDRTYVQQPSPTGNNQYVYQAAVPVTPIYLLVGLRVKVNDNLPNPKDANLNDYNSLWVSIDPATGLILVSDPANVGTDATVLAPLNTSPYDSRYFARQSLANGGGK